MIIKKTKIIQYNRDHGTEYGIRNGIRNTEYLYIKYLRTHICIHVYIYIYIYIMYIPVSRILIVHTCSCIRQCMYPFIVGAIDWLICWLDSFVCVVCLCVGLFVCPCYCLCVSVSSCMYVFILSFICSFRHAFIRLLMLCLELFMLLIVYHAFTILCI